MNILLNISFCISHNKENYTQFEKMINEIMNYSFKTGLNRCFYVFV